MSYYECGARCLSYRVSRTRVRVLTIIVVWALEWESESVGGWVSKRVLLLSGCLLQYYNTSVLLFSWKCESHSLVVSLHNYVLSLVRTTSYEYYLANKINQRHKIGPIAISPCARATIARSQCECGTNDIVVWASVNASVTVWSWAYHELARVSVNCGVY
jgi:hypothetical protein